MLPEPAERNHVDGNQLAAHSQMRIGDTITNIYHLPNGRESYIKAHAVLHQEKPRQYQKKQVWCIVVGAVILVAGMAVAIALPLVRSSQVSLHPITATSIYLTRLFICGVNVWIGTCITDRGF